MISRHISSSRVKMSLQLPPELIIHHQLPVQDTPVDLWALGTFLGWCFCFFAVSTKHTYQLCSINYMTGFSIIFIIIIDKNDSTPMHVVVSLSQWLVVFYHFSVFFPVRSFVNTWGLTPTHPRPDLASCNASPMILVVVSNIFWEFSPRFLQKIMEMIQFDEHIFQISGQKHHHFVIVSGWSMNSWWAMHLFGVQCRSFSRPKNCSGWKRTISRRNGKCK